MGHCFIIQTRGNIISVLSLDGLDKETTALVRDSYQPGTWSNLVTQISSYYEFCDRYQLQELPASSQQLTRYVVYLYKVKKLSSGSIQNYVSGVRTLHNLIGLPVPTQDAFLQKRIIAGIKNRLKNPVKQAVAVTPEMLRRISAVVDFKDNTEMVAWVAILMGFHCLLRSSNLVPASKKAFDPSKNLTRQDFRMHGQVLLVHIKWTKTLQYREKKLLIPVIPFVQDDISALRWFNYMIAKIPAPPDAPAFSIPMGDRLQPLTYSQLSRLLHKWAVLAHINSKTLTSHCLRRGGASWLSERGVPDSIVQAIGDWRTVAFKKYIDQALKTRMQALVHFTMQN